jgi:hypothetical protein
MGKDPAPFMVRWHPGAEKELAKIERDDAREHVSILTAVDKVRYLGFGLPAPFQSAIKGKAGQGFRELRPTRGRSPWRPIYFQAGEKTFVILAIGPEAKKDGRGFNAAVRRARQRFNELS